MLPSVSRIAQPASVLLDATALKAPVGGVCTPLLVEPQLSSVWLSFRIITPKEVFRLMSFTNAAGATTPTLLKGPQHTISPSGAFSAHAALELTAIRV